MGIEINYRPWRKNDWQPCSYEKAMDFAKHKFREANLLHIEDRIENAQKNIRGIKLTWQMFMTQEEYDEEQQHIAIIAARRAQGFNDD